MSLSRYFRDKVVLITGSARGIGRETARLALEMGARVVINGRDPQALDATRLSLGAGDRLVARAADVSRPDQARDLVAQALAPWGRIDVVILNAGVSLRGRFADLADDTVEALVAGNLLSAVWPARAALPALRESRGRMLFVSSLAGVRGFPGVSLYSATKSALSTLRESLAAEEGGTGVRFGLVYLPFTENDPDKTVLAADGRRFSHERRWTLTQRQAALTLLKAVQGGRATTTPSWSGRFLRAVDRWAPWALTGFIHASGGTLHRVKEKGR